MYLRDARHIDKFMYSRSDSLFYESLETTYEPLAGYSEIVVPILKELTDDWVATREGFWLHVHPMRVSLPVQGWKIHVSATLTNAASIVEKVARIALIADVPFKVLLDNNVLSMATSKKWDRGSSGKFITLYPLDTNSFVNLIEQLYAELRGEEGPYILSDKRYKDCKVLYYRYGGIKRTVRVDIKGEAVPVLISPEGAAVPDVRTPYFSPPLWASDPFPAKTSESPELTLKEGRYRVQHALSFSNSGGVYLAEDQTTGASVVIKEARQYTLQDSSGSDAITLLKKEQDILEVLRETGVAPVPIDSFYDWEHFFLVQEHVSGIDIRELMLGDSPLMRINPSLVDTRHFYDIFTRTFNNFATAMDILHKRGIVIGDLSANNLKVDPLTYAVRLIDFEGAYRVGIDKATFLYTPGFRNPLGLKGAPGAKDDLYALAAIMLYTIFPIHALSSLRDDLYDAVLSTILTDIGWADTKVFTVINGLSRGCLNCADVHELLDVPPQLVAPSYDEAITAEDCNGYIQEIGQFILASMGKSKDGLFPADPFMHRTNSLSLGFGACGVLYALVKSGFAIPKHALEWLDRELTHVSNESLAPGLLTGSSGIAWALYELGFEDQAVKFIGMANDSPLLTSHHSLLHGMAGIGMANLYLYLRTGRSLYLSVAEHLGDRLLADARESGDGVFWESYDVIQIGYGYGQSGVALFLLRLSQLSGNETFRAHGLRAMAFDLSHGIEVENGVVSFPRGTDDFTLDPYIEEGSAGIAKVALRYGLWNQMEMILADAHRKYSSFPGLLYGLGSFVDVLTDAYLFSKNDKFMEMAQRPLAGLRDMYLIKHPQGLAVPGDGLLRASCDYATGAGGVLRALYRFVRKDDADFMLDSEARVRCLSNAAQESPRQSTTKLSEKVS